MLWSFLESFVDVSGATGMFQWSQGLAKWPIVPVRTRGGALLIISLSHARGSIKCMPGKVTPHDCRVSVSAAVIDLDHRMPAAHDNTRALKQVDSFVYVMVRLERGPRRERSWRLLRRLAGSLFGFPR